MTRRAVAKTAIALTVALLTGVLAACDDHASGDESKSRGKDDSRSVRPDRKNGKGDKAETAKSESRKFKLGRIDNKDISESSGLAASRKHPGVYWTHNDSGNGPYIFAIQEDGHFLAEFPIANTRNTDWEAIAADDQGRLYIADIGNNDLKRDRALVYRVDEPDPAAVGSKGKGAPVRVGQVIRLSYPDKRFDAESLFLHGGKGYVISKLLSGKNAGLYRFDLAGGSDATPLEHVCDLPIRSPVTDAALSDDGKRLAVMTVTGPNLFQIDGDVAAAGKVVPAYVNYFDPKDMNMEGVCFTPEGLLATTEQGQMLRFGFELFEKK